MTGLRTSYNGATLRNNGGDDLKVFGDGTFVFKTVLAAGAAYAAAVSSQPTAPIGGATADQKIVFTSDQGLASKAGDWLGIGFGGAVDPRSTMQNVRVEFADGASFSGSNSCPCPGIAINDAAIRIFGPPSSQFITNTEILSSARFGIDRGWRADLQPDFLASNIFTAVTSCKETTPRTFNGVCPAVVPCL